MKQLIIIGAGNIGKIVCEYAWLSPDFGVQWEIKGFLDFAGKGIVADKNYPPLIGSIEDYHPKKDDVFVCSFADVTERKRSIMIFQERASEFINIIHPTANICKSAKIGMGNVIGAFTTLSVNVRLGNHVIVQDHCNVGHDSFIKDFCHLYVGNIVSGIDEIGPCATLYTGSTVYPRIKIGENTIVGAGSVVMRVVKDGITVIGNPAKKLD